MCSVTLKCHPLPGRVAARGSSRRSPDCGPNQAEITPPLTLGPPRVYRVAAQIKETIDKAVNAEIEAKLQTVRAEADEREAAIRAEYEGRVYLTPEQLQARVDKAMIPLHIQKYEDKLAKIKEREEKRANAGKADRKRPPIDRELSLAEAGVRSSCGIYSGRSSA
jgi:hypothetical protein